MRLLLLSNSTNYGEDYLKWPEKYIKQFLGDAKSEILFVPYAGVCLDWDDYYDKVSNSLARIGLDVKSLHHGDEKAMIEKARVIMVGGGNSFFLLHNLQKTGVFQLIREMVLNGIPYIGWSAGANVACPTIMTTNDMPIVEPENFKGLNLVRFQINPHYTDKTISNHGGETRAERITEFLEVNSEKTVAGLPEGTLLQVEGDQLAFKGDGVLRIFRKGMPVKEAHPGDSLDWLLKS